jgi:hypothetical protein
MRYIGLLMVVAIIYIAYTHMAAPTPAKTEVTQAMDAGNPDHPAAPGATPTPSTDSLKAPLDRTREVLDQVKKQKSQEQF